MTNSEFSNEFDVLFNNISSNQAPGIDEYEKSVFLTKAQDEILLAYFSPKGNKFLEGFDGSEKRQIDFSSLLTVANIKTPVDDDTINKLDKRSILVNIPTDILRIINETAYVTRNGNTQTPLVIVPVAYTTYNLLMSKPFKRPCKNQAWRLLNSDSAVHSELILGVGDTFEEYTIRYLKRPKAIILTHLEGGLTIDGSSMPQECELDPALHQEILQRAIELARAAYSGDLSSQFALGQASETNMGIIAQGGK